MWSLSTRKFGRTQRPDTSHGAFRPRLEVLEHRCLPSAGALDPTFGNGGVVTGGPISYDQAVIAQPDGKIVLGGESGIARYNANGTLDSRFGNNGVAGLNVSLQINGLALQSNGKIVAVGLANSSTAIEVIRFNADGSFDTTFGGGRRPTGVVVTSLSNSTYVIPRAVAILPDGKIVVSVLNPIVGNTSIYLVRYNSDGTVDKNFGSSNNGIVRTPNLEADSLALQSDGKIIVVGSGGSPTGMAVVRYMSNGQLDTSFNGTGIVTGLVPPGSTSAIAYGVVVESNGTIVIGGPSYSPGSSALTLVSLTNTGQLDTTFGNSGFSASSKLLWGRLNLGANGDILACGTVGVFGNVATYNAGVEAFLPSGAPDLTFETGGITTNVFSGGATAMAIQGDGKMVIAGSVYSGIPGGGSISEMARLQAPDTKISSFTANPNPVTAGSLVTLTVSGILNSNPTSTISNVVFYQDAIGGTPLTVTLISNSNGTWTYSFDTTGLATGTHTLYAQAVDSNGVFSDPLAVTLTVQ